MEPTDGVIFRVTLQYMMEIPVKGFGQGSLKSAKARLGLTRISSRFLGYRTALLRLNTGHFSSSGCASGNVADQVENPSRKISRPEISLHSGVGLMGLRKKKTRTRVDKQMWSTGWTGRVEDFASCSSANERNMLATFLLAISEECHFVCTIRATLFGLRVHSECTDTSVQRSAFG